MAGGGEGGDVDDVVTCVDFWANGFGMRVRIALRELGVAFDYVEEDLRVRGRSALVLATNPVYRSVPILIHRGRPVVNSVNILEYVDEVWGGGASHRRRLLPPADDPLGRANARFWADFIDREVFATQERFLRSKDGQEKAAARAELVGQLRRLEEEALGDGRFLGAGDEFGFLDVVLVPFSSMFRGYELHGGFELAAECPRLARWAERCRERESVREVLPDEEEMYELHKKWYGIE